ncbi:MAG TPA: phage holin family protein [Thermoanaerobaculia bacterium]|jgi:sulfite exporter TauE/SafE|nr:phage holin family protein [Thermoanaerobaculia bacterium]
MQGWINLFRSLGESLIEVLRAETGALQEDLKRSGRHYGVALALFGAAALLSFWVLGLLVFLLITILHVWLQLWAAAAIVFGVFLVVMVVLGLAGRSQWRKAENPVDSVKRHVDDHLDWWQNGLLATGKTVDISAEPVTTGDLSEDLP